MTTRFIIATFLVLVSCNNPNQTKNNVQGTQTVIENAAPQDVVKNFLNTETGEIILDGYIGEANGEHYYIMIRLKSMSKDTYEGQYLYKNVQQYIKLEGKTTGNQLELTEWNEKGEITGRFDGELSEFRPEIEGKWSKPDGSGKLSFHVNKILPLGINNSGQYEFVRLKSSKAGNEKKVQVTDLPDSIQIYVNGLLNVKKDSEMQRLYYEVLYNLNGVLTIAYTQEKDDGWWRTDYYCINLKAGRLIAFDDIFKSESRSEISALAVAKVKENCPEQSDFENIKEFSTDNKKLDFPIITMGGVSFRSPCDRSSGYFFGVRTLDFTFEEIKPYLLK